MGKFNNTPKGLESPPHSVSNGLYHKNKKVADHEHEVAVASGKRREEKETVEEKSRRIREVLTSSIDYIAGNLPQGIGFVVKKFEPLNGPIHTILGQFFSTV